MFGLLIFYRPSLTMQKINVLLANSEDPAVLVEEVALVSYTSK